MPELHHGLVLGHLGARRRDRRERGDGRRAEAAGGRPVRWASILPRHDALPAPAGGAKLRCARPSASRALRLAARDGGPKRRAWGSFAAYGRKLAVFFSF